MSAVASPPDSPSAPYRTPRPVRLLLACVGALVALLLVVQGTLSLLELASRHTTTKTATYRDVTSLVVEDASDIHLTSAPAGAPLVVRARVTEALVSPERHARRAGDGSLRLSSSCPVLFAGSCGVDYEIRVPGGTAVRAETSAGDVVAENLRTTLPIELDSSAGDITLIGATAPSLRVTTSAGDVQASGVSADEVVAGTSAGDVRLSLRTLADRVETHSSAGDVEMVVPDALYRVETESSAGTVDVQEVRTSPDADRLLRAVTSAGDIRIETR
jgi:hypothetical protein